MAHVEFVPEYSGKGFVALEAQGTLFAIARRSDARARPGGGERDVIREFSDASRRRLLRQIARLTPTRTTFITLTYPWMMTDHEEAKRHLKVLLERFRRAYPEVAIIWRMEYQKSGSIHFHMLAFDMPFLPFKKLRQAWAEIIYSVVCENCGTRTTVLTDDDQLPFVRIERVRSWRGVMFYAGKYLAKASDREVGSFLDYSAYSHGQSLPGRFWGVHNRNYLPVAARSFVTIRIETGKGFYDVKRVMRHFYRRLTNNRARGGVIFTNSAQKLWHHGLQLLLADVTDEMFSSDAIQLEHRQCTTQKYPMKPRTALSLAMSTSLSGTTPKTG